MAELGSLGTSRHFQVGNEKGHLNRTTEGRSKQEHDPFRWKLL